MDTTCILGNGQEQKIHVAIEGSYKGLPISIVHYSFVTGSGISRQQHNFIVLRLQATKSFPRILLDAKKNDAWIFSNLPNTIPSVTRMQLEGNFNEAFNVYIEQNIERDVLHFMTPDFMSELMANKDVTDIEIEHDSLFVFTYNGRIDDVATLKRLFSVADTILKHVGEVSDTWQASSSTETVQAITVTALKTRMGLRIGSLNARIGLLIDVIALVIIPQGPFEVGH